MVAECEDEARDPEAPLEPGDYADYALCGQDDAFRIKVEMGTVVRAGALPGDGRWHMGSHYIDASGGGCSAPARAHVSSDWIDHLGEMRARVWKAPGQSVGRLRFSMRHPMDTGLADGIPAFYLNTLDVKTADGRLLGRLDISEPVSENPTMTLLPRLDQNTPVLVLEGRDTDGNEFKAKVPVPYQAGALPADGDAG